MLLELLRKSYDGILSSLIIFFYLGIWGLFLVGITPTPPVGTRQDTKDDSLVMSRTWCQHSSLWEGLSEMDQITFSLNFLSL